MWINLFHPEYQHVGKHPVQVESFFNYGKILCLFPRRRYTSWGATPTVGGKTAVPGCRYQVFAS